MAIQCLTSDKMKYICQRFAAKAQRNINSLVFLYGGNLINLDLNLTFESQANSEDKIKKEMKVLVYKNDNDGFKCPNCGHKIYLNIEEIISSYNNIKDTIDGIKLTLENIIKNSLINTINNQLKSINYSLNAVNEDIKKNNKKLENITKNKNNNNVNVIKNNGNINWNNMFNNNAMNMAFNGNNNINMINNNGNISSNNIFNNNAMIFSFNNNNNNFMNNMNNNVQQNFNLNHIQNPFEDDLPPEKKGNTIFVSFTYKRNNKQIFIDINPHETFGNAIIQLDKKYKSSLQNNPNIYFSNKGQIINDFNKSLKQLHIKDSSDITIHD